MGPLACGHRGARRCPRGCWHRTEACLVVEVIPGACGARTPRGPGRQLLRFKGGVDVLWPAPPPLGPLRERRTLPPPRRSHRGEPEARPPPKRRAGQLAAPTAALLPTFKASSTSLSSGAPCPVPAPATRAGITMVCLCVGQERVDPCRLLKDIWCHHVLPKATS